MKIEIPIFEIFKNERHEVSGKEEYLKAYLKNNARNYSKNYFKKQYKILKSPYVIRCKFIGNNGFIIFKEEDFEKIKKLLKDEGMKLLDVERIQTY